MRLAVLFISFFLVCIPSMAQKKEISQARTNIKKLTDLDKAEASMRELLKDSSNRNNIKIYETLAEAVSAQYLVVNEQVYLKQSFDTVSFFLTARRMFLAYESLDSIDAIPNKRGKVKIKYRGKNSKFLDGYRKNLFNGGLFFIGKKKFDDAYSMMDTYLNCESQPLFKDFNYKEKDTLSYTAAFWSVFCGYKLNRPDSALKYAQLSLQKKRLRRRTLAYLSEIYLQKKDTLNYIKSLRTGFEENKDSKFFFTRLMDYYNGANQLEAALEIADSALKEDKDNTLFLYAKSNVLLNMGRYEECIAISDSLINRQDTIPGVYFNAGVSYLNLALSEEKRLAGKAVGNKKILNYYRKSLPYMEQYRKLRPDEKEKWASSLYNIYLKLNMGRKFDEMNKILSEMRKRQ